MKVDKLKPAAYSLFMLLAIFCIGVMGFMLIERYPLFDAIYMTVITVTTVGFGEVHPLSPMGRMFTSILIVFSFGTFAFSATTLAQYVVNGVFRNYFKYSKVKKEIEQLRNHVIVVGYGRNGLQAIKELQHHKIPVVVVDNRESKVKDMQQSDMLYIDGDPSGDEVLLSAGIKRAKALICVLPSDEENLFAVITARALNPTMTIISRAINFNTIKKLKTAGASRVIMPDKISGQQMANMIAQPESVEFMDYLLLDKSKKVLLDEVSCAGFAETCSVKVKDIRSFERVNVIGIKRNDGNYIVNPETEEVVTKNDLVFVLGTHADIEEFRHFLKKTFACS
jgi:voltage-gated potassium channel